jgi:hypothetical protein
MAKKIRRSKKNQKQNQKPQRYSKKNNVTPERFASVTHSALHSRLQPVTQINVKKKTNKNSLFRTWFHIQYEKVN